MRLNASNNSFILSNSFVFTSCVIILSSIWSTKTSLALNNDIIFKDDTNDFSQSTPLENHNSWQQKLKSSKILNQIPLKYLNKNDPIFRNWIKSHKRQIDDNLPPGFVGARGRRNKPSLWDYKFINENKRNAGEEYKAFTESFPDIWTHFKGEPIDTSDEIMSARLASGKKSDNIVYKDGFLGVRG